MDKEGKPLFIEKINVGNSYSCLSLAPVICNGYRIEAGAIFIVEETVNDESLNNPSPEKGISGILDISSCKRFKFLRYSMLTIPPEERAKVGPGFEALYREEIKQKVNYNWVTIEALKDFTTWAIE